MLLGGLISRREGRALGKTPFLGDIPFLGWAFRNEAETQEEFELVIVVNPVIVRPKRSDARLWGFVQPGEVLEACLNEVISEPDSEARDDSENSEEKQPESGTRVARQALPL